MSAKMTLKDRILAEARSIGFERAGIAPPALAPVAGEALAQFVAAGHHGTMGWMESRQEERRSPDGLWPDVRSVIMLGMNYGPEDDPMEKLVRRSEGNISVYAQNRDYHDIVKKRLKQLARWMVAETGCEVKVFVDTAPVMEKPLAAQAGIGWQGKHTNLVSLDLGSWLFLGSVFTTLDLEPDRPETDHCGSCRACLDICPTDAFPAPYRMDARRCISYLTIEHKGSIPEAFRKAMGNRIYGCDDCLAVCPWNKFAERAAEAAFHPREELKGPLLSDLAALDEAAFREMFRASPVKRIGRDRFVRNVLIAIGNSADVSLLPAAQDLRDDPDPVVAEAARWAVGQF